MVSFTYNYYEHSTFAAFPRLDVPGTGTSPLVALETRLHCVDLKTIKGSKAS